MPVKRDKNGDIVDFSLDRDVLLGGTPLPRVEREAFTQKEIAAVTAAHSRAESDRVDRNGDGLPGDGSAVKSSVREKPGGTPRS